MVRRAPQQHKPSAFPQRRSNTMAKRNKNPRGRSNTASRPGPNAPAHALADDGNGASSSLQQIGQGENDRSTEYAAFFTLLNCAAEQFSTASHAPLAPYIPPLQTTG
ncbi:hypothetical protein [Paraburkholderia phenoliruptrix]|uniref:hypothetical protein n=1 Tax=Paraburkholderia phenoliruptrix TaxID=252970 RepID=UPI003D97D922